MNIENSQKIIEFYLPPSILILFPLLLSNKHREDDRQFSHVAGNTVRALFKVITTLYQQTHCFRRLVISMMLSSYKPIYLLTHRGIFSRMVKVFSFLFYLYLGEHDVK